jgi:hypothetical protein
MKNHFIADSTSGLSPLARVRLTGELTRVIADLQTASPIKKISLSKRALEIIAQLTANKQPAAEEHPAIVALQAIADGKRDASVADLNGLLVLLMDIKGAVDQLESDDSLNGAEAVAHAAIDRWADLEQVI